MSRPKTALSFASRVHHIIHNDRFREGAAVVGEQIYYLQSLSLDGDVGLDMAFQALVGASLLSLLCWLFGQNFHRPLRTCQHCFACWLLVEAFSAQSLTISVFSLVFAWSLLQLKIEPSVRYWMSIRLSEPLKASTSIAENMILKRVRTMKHPCLTQFLTGKHRELSPSSCMQVVMKLSNDGDELFGTSLLCDDSLKPVAADHVKCLGQININRIEVSVLSLTLLLELSCSKHYLKSSTFLTEAIFPLR